MPKVDQPAGYRVGDVTLDLVHRRIQRLDETLPAGRLTFEFLLLLAEQAPRVVSRETLVERLWDGRYVNPATIKRRVALVRRTLGDHADDPSYIRVVRGYGYSLIPEVRSLDAQASERRRPGNRFRLAAAAAAFVAFVLGAEIGYQDGLRPARPALRGSASIFVTSGPHELPQEDFSFVMGTAEEFVGVIRESHLLGRLGRADTANEAQHARDPLAVIANATTDDVESVYVTLALLRDSRADYRISRTGELAWRSRAFQDVELQPSEQLRSALRPAQGAGSPRVRRYKVQVFPPTHEYEGPFLLVANFHFDRRDIQASPRATQSDAALSVAMAIDEQVGALESSGVL